MSGISTDEETRRRSTRERRQTDFYRGTEHRTKGATKRRRTPIFTPSPPPPTTTMSSTYTQPARTEQDIAEEEEHTAHDVPAGETSGITHT